MISESSIPIGSVGISAVPIFEITCTTSGKLSLIIFSTFEVVRILSSNELPGCMLICIAIFPSCKVGTNSAPILAKTKRKKSQITKMLPMRI